MQAYELVFMCGEIMKSLSKVDVKMTDYKHIPMYQEYKDLVAQGYKIGYVRVALSEKYNLSESTVDRLVRRFGKVLKK